MPALTITAIDHNTGTLTIPGHGLLTGDGPGAMFALPGGALPTGLAPVTDYFAIRIDNGHIKLADSNAHALAGTALTFLTDGSGPLQFLVGLPYRRPRAYAAGSQLKSADLNANSDSWVALWNLLTGQAQSVYGDVRLTGALGIGGVLIPSGGVSAFTALGQITANLGLLAGANQHITLSGTGAYKRGALTEFIPPLAGIAVAGSPTIAGNSIWSFSSTNDRIVIAIRLTQSQRLLRVRTKVSCGATTVIRATLNQNDPDAQTLPGAPSVDSVGHAGATENIDHNPSVLASSSTLFTLILAPTAFSGPAFFRGCEITTDVP